MPEIYLSPEACTAIVCALVFLVFDILVGFVCAIVRHDFKSQVMREGIGHKAVIVLIIVLACLLEVASHLVDGITVDIPLVITVCVYVILMEVASVLETIKQTYPELAGSGIFDLFGDKEGANES